MFTATIFDTETPGFKSKGIMQLAAVMVDEEFKPIANFSTLIKPELYDTVEPGAQAVHGLTMEHCERHGIPLVAALGVLSNFTKVSDVMVCHNWAYDSRVVGECLAALGRENFLTRTRNFCTMQALTPICKIPGPRGHKWPKLQEAHKFFFNEEFESAHDALADVQATVKLLQKIKADYPQLLTRV